MAEHYPGLEVAHTEHVQSSPEVLDYSTFAPQRTSLSHNSPEVVSEPTFGADTNHHSVLSEKTVTDNEEWPPQVSCRLANDARS